ncbi:MAG: mechanosensitive ion channel family protein [Candidatus Omnitrophota bacterium]
MSKELFVKALSLIDIFMPLIVFIAVLCAGIIIKQIIFKRFLYWSRKTTTQIDDIIVQAIKGPVLVLCFILALYFALQFSKLAENIVQIVGKSIFVLGIFSVMLAVANSISAVIKIYAARADSTVQVTSLTQNIAKIFIFSIGLLVILNTLGISITPILATLGVGGLAVALALQDTLANLFAGFHISVAKQVRVGDFIKLETGEEGYVVDINWRSTKIKMLPNNLVLIPNDKLNKAIIINYCLPDKEMAVLVDLRVHYKSDLENVEKVTCEVAKATMVEVAGGVAHFDPFIRYHTFGDSCIKFTVILRAKEFVDQYLIKHEFVKRLHKRYIQEGINIPYPIRAINYEQEK